MLLCNLFPATSRAIKEHSRGRHPSPQGKGVASLSRSHLNMESPLVDSKPVYLRQASDCSSMECHPRIERGKAVSRRSRITARIERCRLIQRFFRRTPHKETCVSCLESMPADELVNLPCQHKYCNMCIRRMAATSMADEQLFPPRCCSRKIPSETVLPLLSPKERGSFVSKATEHKYVRIVAREFARGVAAFPTGQEIALLMQICLPSLKWLGFSDGRGVSIVVRWWSSYSAVITLHADAAHNSAINAVNRGLRAFVSHPQRGQ
ncbi:hypothetical protein AARAC_008090 [Aspergillus arachidicola]|uniref:RING-type domain-containing protein n=1 Tax=Aspergillus arachidicola TaxID=656916 RepID=A0A2G7FGI1_9EURO|nr:hypothetical protein AARAC_008090 [Aspergillus arachidicola]